MTTTYHDIEITYDEIENKWKFTLRGRDRSADSLGAAKAAIDKQPTEKAKPFEKIPAWQIHYNGPIDKVELTSIAERQYGRDYVWIKDSAGKRSKEVVERSIYPQNPTNDAIIAEIIQKKDALKALSKKIECLKEQLKPLKLEIQD